MNSARYKATGTEEVPLTTLRGLNVLRFYSWDNCTIVKRDEQTIPAISLTTRSKAPGQARLYSHKSPGSRSIRKSASFGK